MKLAKKTETNFSQGRYWQETEIEVTECTDPMEMIQLIPEVVDQEVEGFGGAFTEASAYNYAKLGKKEKQDFIRDYFGDDGLRYNMGRITINSCDFALGNYTYVEEGDSTLDSFKNWFFEYI